MNNYNNLMEKFVEQSKRILGNNLVGIYLHGSSVLGCFNENKSDIDLLVVVNTIISDEDKHNYMDMVVELNANAPAKGIELSIVRKDVCKPFVYPTPFELHFSIAHLEWYKTNPTDYIEKMNGTDKDLAAHFTIIYYRGKTFYGKEIKDIFEKVDKILYFDSIWNDIECAKEEIAQNPMYIILNLCRVLAYKKEELILSKLEGGKWGIENVPEKYRNIIQWALNEYSSDEMLKLNKKLAVEYAAYMIEQIKNLSNY